MEVTKERIAEFCATGKEPYSSLMESEIKDMPVVVMHGLFVLANEDILSIINMLSIACSMDGISCESDLSELIPYDVIDRIVEFTRKFDIVIGGLPPHISSAISGDIVSKIREQPGRNLGILSLAIRAITESGAKMIIDKVGKNNYGGILEVC